MSVVVKVERPLFGDRRLWDVRDQKGDIARMINPSHLPERVRKTVASVGVAYFYATIERGELMFGNRVVGNPGWTSKPLV